LVPFKFLVDEIKVDPDINWMKDYRRWLEKTKDSRPDYKVYTFDVNGIKVIDITATLEA
jgi:cytochrome b subunit of formate dehydrogenase